MMLPFPFQLRRPERSSSTEDSEDPFFLISVQARSPFINKVPLMSTSRIIRHGTVDLSAEPRPAHEIVRERTDGLGKGLTYGEAIRVLQATIEELREQASLERLREAEQNSSGEYVSIEEVKRRLGVETDAA